MCENDRILLIFKLRYLIVVFKQRNSVACCDSPEFLRKHSFSSPTVTQYSSISTSMSGECRENQGKENQEWDSLHKNRIIWYWKLKQRRLWVDAVIYVTCSYRLSICSLSCSHPKKNALGIVQLGLCFDVMCPVGLIHVSICFMLFFGILSFSNFFQLWFVMKIDA